MQQNIALYDKNGEEHYNIISALHKSMRNSDPDAAVYWLARMLEAGEDPVHNTMEYYLDSINTIYSIKHKNGAIRRVNVNIAATTVENYRKLKEAGIGTYILFQETYHKESYERLHPTGPKHNYCYHTEAMDRAMEAVSTMWAWVYCLDYRDIATSSPA